MQPSFSILILFCKVSSYNNHSNCVVRIYNFFKENLSSSIKNVLTKFNCYHKPFSAIPCNDISACSICCFIFCQFFFNFFSPWSKKLVSARLVMTPIYFQILTIQPTLHNLHTTLDVCHLQAVFKILCTTNGLVLASVQGKKYTNCLQSSLLEIEIGVDIPWQKVLQFFNFKYPSQWVKNLNIVLK